MGVDFLGIGFGQEKGWAEQNFVEFAVVPAVLIDCEPFGYCRTMGQHYDVRSIVGLTQDHCHWGCSLAELVS